MRQAQRMRYLSDGVVMAGKTAVTDFVCPTEAARLEFDPDFTVWMNTIEAGRFEDTNKMFETPPLCDYHVSEWFEDAHEQLIPVIQRWMAINNV
jgi:adenylylsulfate kinase